MKFSSELFFFFLFFWLFVFGLRVEDICRHHDLSIFLLLLFVLSWGSLLLIENQLRFSIIEHACVTGVGFLGRVLFVQFRLVVNYLNVMISVQRPFESAIYLSMSRARLLRSLTTRYVSEAMGHKLSDTLRDRRQLCHLDLPWNNPSLSPWPCILWRTIFIAVRLVLIHSIYIVLFV